MSDKTLGGDLQSVLIGDEVWTDTAEAVALTDSHTATLTVDLSKLNAALRDVLGVRMVPAKPSVREAAEDVLDATVVLLSATFGAVALVLGKLGAAVAARWSLLCRREWRRLRGPVVRFWDAEMQLLGTVPDKVRETWRQWAIRQARFVWAVLLTGEARGWSGVRNV